MHEDAGLIPDFWIVMFWNCRSKGGIKCHCMSKET
jgi:hypothetical protein